MEKGGNKMSRPTPETDAELNLYLRHGEAHQVSVSWIEFARKLERELNEAWKELEEYRSIAESNGAVKAVCEKEKAIRERDEAREETVQLLESSNRLISLLREQLTEARDIGEKLSKQGLDILDENRSLKRERDTALDEAQAYSKGTWQSLRESQDEVLRLTFENREVTQDLDKARDAIMKVEEIFVDGENTHDDWFKMGSIAREYFKK
jgi:hypothetical protein